MVSQAKVLVSAFLLLSLSGCIRQELNPVAFRVSVPSPNTIQFSAELTARLGLGLNGSFPILGFGSFVLEGESLEHGFQFGFRLNTAAFQRESWVNFREVDALPTGVSFPTWMRGEVTEVIIPPANIDEIEWRYYFGMKDQRYVGVAAIIKSIDGSFPSINIGYTFYDPAGRVAVGLQFFGPYVERGRLIVPGGIFIGTNLSPYLPDIQMPFTSASSVELAQFSSSASQGFSGDVKGQASVSSIEITGKQASKYQSEAKIREAIGRFTAATKGAAVAR